MVSFCFALQRYDVFWPRARKWTKIAQKGVIGVGYYGVLLFSACKKYVVQQVFAGSSVNLEHHLAQNCIGSILADESSNHLTAKGKSGTCTAACDELAIAYSGLLDRSGTQKIFLKTRVTGGAMAFKQAHQAIDHRGGTDSSQELACLGKLADDSSDLSRIAQVDRAWHSAWKEEHVAIGEVSRRQQLVGYDLDAIAGGDNRLVVDTNRGDFDASTTEDVNGKGGLGYLKAGGEEDIGFHEVDVVMLLFKRG